VPDATRIGVLWDPANEVHRPSLRIIESAAQRLRVDLHLAGVQDPKEMEHAFSALSEKGVQALVVFPDGMFQAQTPQILALAARYRLPSLYGLREYAELGGLMAYGANLAKMHRQLSASLVDKILRGAQPANLPVAQPTEFDLLINLKTAKALGLTIPPSLLQRADQVIE
jgi:putative ABC transport system substrate-binding protein